MAMDSVFRVSLVLDMIDNMTSGVDKVAGSVDGSVKRMNDTFGTMQKAGAVMTGAGTAILTAGAGIVKSTFDTQNALAEVRSLGVEDLGALEKAAKSFSDTWAGTTKADFISASYDIKSGIASLTDEGVAQYTELAALTAKATKATAGDMTALFATGYGIYKNYYSDLSDMEFGEMFSAGIATAVKNYKTSGTQMADSIKTLGASAVNANVPMEEQLAILGQLQATMSGSEAGTKYKAFLNSAASAGDKLGLSFLDANNQLVSMPEIMDKLRSKYGDTIDAMEKKEIKEAFGTDEAVALIDLLYNNTDQLRTGIEDLQTSMEGGTATTQAMAEAINNTPEQKFTVLKQKVHNVTEELGSGLLPSVNNVLEKVGDLIQKGSDWVSSNQETVNTIMNIIMYLGVFLVIAGGAAALVGTLGKALTTLKGVLGIAKGAMALFNGTLLASPITWIIALIVGLIAAFALCGGDVEKLSGIMQGVFSRIAGFVGSAVDAIIAYLPSFLQFGLDLVVQVVTGIGNALPGLASAGLDMISTLANAIVTYLPVILQAGINILLQLLQGIIAGIPRLLQTGMSLIAAIASGITQYLPNILQLGVTILQMLLSGVLSVASMLGSAGLELIRWILNGIISGVTALISAGAQVAPMILSGISSTASSLISGGISLIGSILQGIITGVPALIGMMPGLFGQVIDTITSIDWIGVGADLVGGIADGFMAGFQGLVDSAKGLWDKFTGWLSGDDAEVEIEPKTTTHEVKTTSSVQTVSGAGKSFDTAGMQKQGAEAIAAVQAGVESAPIDVQAQGQEMMSSLMAGLESSVPDAQATAATSAEDIMASFNLGEIVPDSMLGDNLTDQITAGAAGATAAAEQAGADIMSAFNADDLTALMTDVSDASVGVTDSMTQMGTNVSTQMDTAWKNAESGTASAMSSIKSSVTASMSSVVSVVTSKANAAASAITSAFAGISVTVPSPKLPHISVSYRTVGSGNAKAQVPDFSVAYFAKGGIMTRPTMFGMAGGKGLVGGEAGDEAILPLTELWSRMRAVVSDVVHGKGEKQENKIQLAPKPTARVSGIQTADADEGSSERSTKSRKSGTIIQKLVINANFDDIDQIDKLKKLIRELEEDSDPNPAIA